MDSEAWRQELCELTAAERACQWAKGEVIARAIQVAANRKARTHIFRDAASVMHCSTFYARVLAEVWATFKPYERAEDKQWSFHRACMEAAKRLKREPLTVLLEALDQGLHVRGINQLGRSENGQHVYQLDATCGGCGLKVRLSASFATPSLPCPNCVKVAWDDGRDGKDVDSVGYLR